MCVSRLPAHDNGNTSHSVCVWHCALVTQWIFTFRPVFSSDLFQKLWEMKRRLTFSGTCGTHWISLSNECWWISPFLLLSEPFTTYSHFRCAHLCANHVSSMTLYMAVAVQTAPKALNRAITRTAAESDPVGLHFKYSHFQDRQVDLLLCNVAGFYCIFSFCSMFFAIVHFFPPSASRTVAKIPQSALELNTDWDRIMRELWWWPACRLLQFCLQHGWSFYCLSDDSQRSDSTLSYHGGADSVLILFWNPIAIGSLEQVFLGWLRCAALMSCSDGLSAFSPPQQRGNWSLAHDKATKAIGYLCLAKNSHRVL